MFLVGKKAPDFTLEVARSDRDTFDNVSLKDYAGSWLILFFYPRDFTFV